MHIITIINILHALLNVCKYSSFKFVTSLIIPITFTDFPKFYIKIPDVLFWVKKNLLCCVLFYFILLLLLFLKHWFVN